MTRENFMWITQFTQNNFKTSYKLSKLFTESSTFARRGRRSSIPDQGLSKFIFYFMMIKRTTFSIGDSKFLNSITLSYMIPLD